LYNTTGTTVLSANTRYQIKLTYDGISAYNLFYSDDNGDTWNLELTTTQTTAIYTPVAQFCIGNSIGASNTWFTGIIHLENSYFKINDADWWTGITTTPTPQLFNGQDYWLYECVNPSDQVVPVVTFSGDRPTGYNNYRKVGGFHTLCRDAGVIPDDPYIGVHPLSGYVAGDILTQSVWCLNHDAMTAYSMDGMVYCEIADAWIDIYSMGVDGTSQYGNYTANTLQHFVYTEMGRVLGKQLFSPDEYFYASQGSNQQTIVKGSAKPNPFTTGGREDNADRRMLSAIGCEEMCGLICENTRDYSAFGGNSFTNNQTGGQGQIFGNVNALTTGTHWDSSQIGKGGSRSFAGNVGVTVSADYYGARCSSPANHMLRTDIR
jgi:hypothetical protein